MKNGKLNMKKSAIAVFSLALLSSPIHPFTNGSETANAIQATKAEQILSTLSAKQREALHQLEVTKSYGVQGFQEDELKGDKQVSIIVQFKSEPGKVAVLESALKGKELTNAKAEEQVEKEHQQFKTDIGELLPDRDLHGKKSTSTISRTYKKAFNGVAMKIPANQVSLLMESEVVQTVYKDKAFSIDPVQQENPKDAEAATVTSVESIPFLKIDQLHEEGITGKGIKVGVLDTGVDYNHPDLKDAYKGGYDFVDNDADPMETTYKDWKESEKSEFVSGQSYYTSHGTHVSGTIVGQGENDSEVSVEGVAPDAELHAYRVLGPYGSGSSEAVIAGIEKAVEDGMDVINLSLGAPINDPYYPTSTAINYAVLNGVTAVVSAGNSGPNEYTLGSPGTAALALTVGASDVPVSIAKFMGKIGDWSSQLVSMGRNYASTFSELEGLSLEIEEVGIGSSEDYLEKDVDGKIALIERGVLAIQDKIKIAKEHGAKAVIIYNNEEGQIPFQLGESPDFVPTFSMTRADGVKLKEKLNSDIQTLTFEDFKTTQTQGDKLADFSSRGPARTTYDMKPEVVAPGVSVLSTFPSYMINHEQPEDYTYAYSRLSGTSMAAPHVAGMAALLKGVNPEMDSDDIKTVLMNTSDSLSEDYSVFEVGAGRVDPYQAVHSQMKIQVVDETAIPEGTDLVMTKDLTGGLSFDNHYEVEGKHMKIRKTLEFSNDNNQTKSFDISVEENVQEGSNSMKENGVTLNLPKTIKVGARKTKKSNVFMLIPKTAKAGIYEGYITMTNKENPNERYRVPYSVRTTGEGFNSFNVVFNSISPDLYRTSGFGFYKKFITPFTFNMKAPMDSIDVVLTDGKTGAELGLVGTLNMKGALDNRDYLIRSGFAGVYYPFTNDSNQPVAQDFVYAEPGYYKVKFIGTSLTGKRFIKEDDVFIDVEVPTFNSSLDQENGSPFIEYKEGQETYPLNIQVTDPTVKKMNGFGMDVKQSSNSMLYYWNSAFPSFPIQMDDEGRFSDEIAMKESVPSLRFSMLGMDGAGNEEGQKSYYFVKEDTPVAYATSKVKAVSAGDEVEVNLMLDNMSNIESTTWSLTTQGGSIQDVQLTDELKKQGATLEVDGQDIKVNFAESITNADHLQIAKVIFKVQEKGYLTYAGFLPEVTYLQGGGTDKTSITSPLHFNVRSHFSSIAGPITPEGFFVQTSGQTGYYEKRDYTKVGQNVTITDHKGNVYDLSDMTSSTYSTEIVEATDRPVQLKVEIPGHFTHISNHQIGFEYKEKLHGSYQRLLTGQMTAGDVNGDDVIDIYDAMEVQKAWKSNMRNADINFDGTVDEKDMTFIKTNYMKVNPDGKDVPSPKTKHNGKDLDDILVEVGMK
jgi:subtilisin family serine protease